MGLLETLGVVIAVGAAATVVLAGFKIFRKFEHFFEDWYGEAAREGVPPRPGILGRMENQERGLEKIRKELVTNGGTSLRDAVNRIDRNGTEQRQELRDAVRTIDERVEGLREKMDADREAAKREREKVWAALEHDAMWAAAEAQLENDRESERTEATGGS